MLCTAITAYKNLPVTAVSPYARPARRHKDRVALRTSCTQTQGACRLTHVLHADTRAVSPNARPARRHKGRVALRTSCTQTQGPCRLTHVLHADTRLLLFWSLSDTHLQIRAVKLLQDKNLLITATSVVAWHIK